MLAGAKRMSKRYSCSGMRDGSMKTVGCSPTARLVGVLKSAFNGRRLRREIWMDATFVYVFSNYYTRYLCPFEKSTALPTSGFSVRSFK
jgi:hypothetical protein